jgi:hypothetical protein
MSLLRSATSLLFFRDINFGLKYGSRIMNEEPDPDPPKINDSLYLPNAVQDQKFMKENWEKSMKWQKSKQRT